MLQEATGSRGGGVALHSHPNRRCLQFRRFSAVLPRPCWVPAVPDSPPLNEQTALPLPLGNDCIHLTEKMEATSLQPLSLQASNPLLPRMRDPRQSPILLPGPPLRPRPASTPSSLFTQSPPLPQHGPTPQSISSGPEPPGTPHPHPHHLSHPQLHLCPQKSCPHSLSLSTSLPFLPQNPSNLISAALSHCLPRDPLAQASRFHLLRLSSPTSGPCIPASLQALPAHLTL